ncbi:hypothetical protein [Streptomyces afghaniensis]|uniref:hypothetical protein n=1 Tax=Streptomyces afghaniensis TaxID=66865 RepID=UPI0027D7ABFB|nr:hypothetical protein [Streptomyces afghaniensis]
MPFTLHFQRSALTPLLADWDTYEGLAARIEEADAEQAALRYFMAARTAVLHEAERAEPERSLTRLESEEEGCPGGAGAAARPGTPGGT